VGRGNLAAEQKGKIALSSHECGTPRNGEEWYPLGMIANHWHHLQPGRTFAGTLLIITFLFRAWVVVIIMTFAATRYGLSEQLIAAGAISGLAVVIDFFFTARQFVGWDTYPALQFTTYILKTALILIAVCYAANIWYVTHVLPYAAFGLFVAAVFALDFLILKKKRTKPLQREPKTPMIRPSLFLVLPMLLLPVAARAAVTIESVGSSLGLGSADLKQTIVNITQLVLGLLGLIALIMIIYSIIVAATTDDSDRAEKAKGGIIAAMIGLVIILIAWAIVTFVIGTTRNVSS
jgi:hypothetical protein